MLTGIRFIEQKQNLAKMDKNLPVLFIAGEDDPVRKLQKGVGRLPRNSKAGMKDSQPAICSLRGGMKFSMRQTAGRFLTSPPIG